MPLTKRQTDPTRLTSRSTSTLPSAVTGPPLSSREGPPPAFRRWRSLREKQDVGEEGMGQRRDGEEEGVEVGIGESETAQGIGSTVEGLGRVSDGPGPPHLSRSTSIPSSTYSSIFKLTRSLSLRTHHTAASTGSLLAPPLPPPRNTPSNSGPRKLTKARPSLPPPSSRRAWASAVALPLHSPSYPSERPSLALTRTRHSTPPQSLSASGFDSGQGVSSARPLSRNGSSSTATSTSSSSSAIPTSSESTGLSTPQYDHDLDLEPPIANRGTFGHTWDIANLDLGPDRPDGFGLERRDSSASPDEGDDFRPPRFPHYVGDEDDHSTEQAPSTKTSSSGRTAIPLSRAQVSPALFDLPHERDVGSEEGRPVAIGAEDTAESEVERKEERGGKEGISRHPLIYDLEEMLRSAAGVGAGAIAHIGGGPTGSTRTHRSARYRSHSRSASVGTPSEMGLTMDEVLHRGPSRPDSLVSDPQTSWQGDITSPRGSRPPIPHRHYRPAPAPPHLIPAPPVRGPGADLLGPIGGPPVIPDRSTSLGQLWRRMSGRSGRSGSSSEAVPSGATLEVEPGCEGGKKLQRPGMLRSLSRRRTAPHGQDVLLRTRREEEKGQIPPVPPHHAQLRSIPPIPPRRRSSIPPEASIPIPTTRSPPDPSTAATSHLIPQAPSIPSPPAQIPNRASSLPVRPGILIPNNSAAHRSSLPESFSTIPEHPSSPSPHGSNTSWLPRPPLHSGVETGSERKRRFRRTLVEVVDDVQFQRLLQDGDRMGTLESPASGVVAEQGASERYQYGVDGVGLAITTNTPVQAEPEDLGDAPLSPIVDSPFGLDDGGIDRQIVQAWFVTRELVQGEKRYGRSLARGISIARSVAEKLNNQLDFASSCSLSGGGSGTSTSPSKRFARLSASLGSSPISTLRRSRMMSAPALNLSTYSSSSLLHLPLSSSSTTTTCLSSPVSPLGILLYRLPRLLALSLTLSSRFAHDPSPDQVATAFLSMEDEIMRELSAWAGEVGQLIAMGFGEMLDREMREDGSLSRNSTMGDIAHLGMGPIFGPPFDSLDQSSSTAFGSYLNLLRADTTQEDRTSFSEILLAPIQRAARYRLLFHSLVVKMPKETAGREKVQAALWAAERIVHAVNKGQGFDLEGLRREEDETEDGRRGGGGDGDTLVMRKRTKGKGMERRVRSMVS